MNTTISGGFFDTDRLKKLLKYYLADNQALVLLFTN